MAASLSAPTLPQGENMEETTSVDTLSASVASAIVTSPTLPSSPMLSAAAPVSPVPGAAAARPMPQGLPFPVSQMAPPSPVPSGAGAAPIPQAMHIPASTMGSSSPPVACRSLGATSLHLPIPGMRCRSNTMSPRSDHTTPSEPSRCSSARSGTLCVGPPLNTIGPSLGRLSATSPIHSPRSCPGGRSRSGTGEHLDEILHSSGALSPGRESLPQSQHNSPLRRVSIKSPRPSLPPHCLVRKNTTSSYEACDGERSSGEDAEGSGSVEQTFQMFCGSRPDMDGRTLAKLCKDCGLIDRALSINDVDIIFKKKVPKGQRRIDLQQFKDVLAMIAEKKGVPLEDIHRLVETAEGPVLNSTTPHAVRFHDDKSTYTGTHVHGGPDMGSKSRGHTPCFTFSTHTVSHLMPPEQEMDSRSRTPSPMPPAAQADRRDRSPPPLPPTTTTTATKSLGRNFAGLSPTGKSAGGTIEDTFRVYCGSRADMGGKEFAKLCKDCHLVDEVTVTSSGTDIIFAKVKRGQRRIDFLQFKEALQHIADKKGVSAAVIHRSVAASEGPVLKGTKTEVVRFYDDKSQYTGVHLHGGPDTGSKSASVQERDSQGWFSSLRDTESKDDALPGMILKQMGERSPSPRTRSKSTRVASRGGVGAERGRQPPMDSDQVTMVFTDVQGSTSLWEADPDAMEQALSLHDSTIRKVLAKHNGYEVTTEGDAFQLCFHDAFDAVGFCLDVQTELLAVDWPAVTLTHPDAAKGADGAWNGLRVRMGMHSGRPESVRKHEMTRRWCYAGASVALAKAVEGVCHGGQIVASHACFSQVDGMLTQLGSPQVIDLGEHVLEGKGVVDPASGDEGKAVVRLVQLVPEALAYNYSPPSGDAASGERGRLFPPVLSGARLSPGFEQSPSGPSITLCFVFTKGVSEIAASVPALAATCLGGLRRTLRTMLQEANGYECQEDEGAFMLAFHSMGDCAAFATSLQRAVRETVWPQEVQRRGGLRVSVGALSGGYTSRRPHSTTGRADYFGTIVNRTARIAAAAHAGQVLLGGDCPLPPESQLEERCSLQRLGAFHLKGIDSPMVLTELVIPDADGSVEAFPEPRTKGRVSN